MCRCEQWWISIKFVVERLALGEEADFEALNSLPALNLIQSTKLHLTTESAFLPNVCYLLPLFSILSAQLFCYSIYCLGKKWKIYRSPNWR
jgi:hypothetical protein